MADPHKPFRRHHDDPLGPPIVPMPQSHFYPTSRQDLIDIVQAAELQADPKPEVRAVGSHWALSEAAVTHDYVVETRDPDGDPGNLTLILNKTLYDVFPDCLTPESQHFFATQGVKAFDPQDSPDHEKFYLYHVEA